MLGTPYPLQYVAYCEGLHFAAGYLSFLSAFSAVYWLFSWISITYSLIGTERRIFLSSLFSGLFASSLSHLLADVYSWGF